MSIYGSPLSREPIASISKESSPQDTSAPSRSLTDEEKWLTSWNCHLNYPMCTAYSTCHNSGNVSKSHTSLIFTRTSIIKPLTFSLIWLTVRALSAFWMRLNGALEAAPSSTSRSNGATTLKQKQLGNVKATLDPSFHISLKPSLGISGTRFL